MPAGGKRVTATLDIQAQVTNYQESLKKLQGAISSLHLPDGLKKGFDNLFIDYQKELEKLSKNSANNKLSILNEKEIEKSFDKIESYYSSLVKKLRNSNYKESILEADFQAIEKMKEAQVDYSKAVKDSKKELDREQDALDKLKAKLDEQKKAQKSLGGTKGGATAAQKKAQKAVEDTTKALQEQKTVAKEADDQYKEQQNVISKTQKEYEKALRAQARAQKELNDYKESHQDKDDNRTRTKILNLTNAEKEASEKVTQAEKALNAEKDKGAQLQQKANEEELKREKIVEQVAEAKKKESTATSSLNKATADYEKKAQEVRQTESQLSQQTENVNKKRQAYEILANNTLTELVEGFKKVAEAAGIDTSKIKSIEDIKQLLDQLGGEAKDKAAPAIKEVEENTEQAGKAGEKASSGFKESADSLHEMAEREKEVRRLSESVLRFFSIDNAVRLFKRAIRSAYETITDLDKVMTETAVVTDFSVGDMWSQLPEYTKRANELGVSIHSAYEAATIYYQQGLKTNEVMQVSNQTLKMARIAGLDAAEATDRMTNALRGFNMEINEVNATRIADVYSKLAAISASNVDEISTAMTKVASLASNANMEFETTAAFLSQIIETTRESAETAGTALKTVVARFSEVKKLYSEGQLTGADEEGQEIDVNKVSTALRTAGINLNEYLSGAKGLDDIFIELASKWDSLDKVQQRYIATMAAGSRQQSRFIAMMSDYKRTQELVSAAQNASGASAEQYEKTLDSLETKLNQLKNAWDEFTMSLVDSSVTKFVVDTGTTILNLINKLTGAFGDFGGSVSKILLLIGGLKIGKAIFNKLINSFVAEFVGIGQKSGQSFMDGLKEKINIRSLKNINKPITELQKNIQKEFKKATKNKAVLNAEDIFGKIDATQLQPYADDIVKQFREKINFSQLTSEERKNAQTAIDGFTSAIKDSGKTGQQALQPLNDELDKVGEKLTINKEIVVSSSKDYVTAYTTAGAAVGTFSMLLGLLNTGLKELEAPEKVTDSINKISSGLGAMSMILMGMPRLLEAVGVSAGTTLATATMGISLVITALITIGTIAAKFYESTSEKADRLNDEIKKINENVEDSKTAMKNLEDSRSNLNSLQEEISGLTRGTKDWRNKLIEVNQQVLELINKYPSLVKYVERTNGVLNISELGWNTLIEDQSRGIQNSISAGIGLNIEKLKTGRRADFEKAISSRERGGVGWADRAILDVADFLDSDVAHWIGRIGGIFSLGLGDITEWLPKVFGTDMRTIATRQITGKAGISGVTEEQYYKIAEIAAKEGVLSSDTAAIFKIIEENTDLDKENIQAVTDSIATLGEEFDEFGIKLLQTSEEVDNYKNSLIDSAINSDTSLVGSAFSEQIATALSLSDAYSDIEKVISEKGQEINGNLKQIYAEEVSGFYENGKLYSDETMQNELDLSEETLRNGIASVRIVKDLQKTAKQINTRILAIKNTQPEVGNILERALTKEGQGLTRADLEALTSNNRDNKTYNTVTSVLPGINVESNIASAEQMKKRVDTLLGNFDFDIQDNIKGLQLSIGSEKKLIETLLRIPEDNRGQIVSKITGLGDRLKGAGASSDQISSVFEYLASSDLSNADSIYNFISYLKELGIEIDEVEISNFTNDLIELTNATKNFTLENVINELKTTKDIIDSLFDGKRDFSQEQYEQAIANGMDPEQFVKTVDGWRYIGEMSTAATQNIVAQVQQIDGMLLNLQQYEDKIDALLAKEFGAIDITNPSNRPAGMRGVEFDGYNKAADSAGLQAKQESDQADLEAELEQATKDAIMAIQALVGTGSLDAIINTQETINLVQDEERKIRLVEEYDKALIGIAQTYDDLYQDVLNLERATTEEEKTNARLILGLKVGAKQAEKQFKSLSETVTNSLDAIKNKDLDGGEYQKALSSIAQAAARAFGDNSALTADFVEQNLQLFEDYANGVEGSENRIREALLAASEYSDLTTEQVNGIGDALAYLRNNSDLQLYGTADFSQIFNELVALMGSAEAAAKEMERLGYTVNWELGDPPYTYVTIPDPNNPGGQITVQYPNYKAVVTDGFGDRRRANTVAARKNEGRGKGGGGSSKKDKQKNWKNPYDELYNLTEQINENSRQRNLLEAEYDLMLNDRTKANDVLLKNSYEQLKNLEKELALQKEMQAGRKRQLDNILNETYEDSEGNRKTYKQLGVEGYAHYDQNTQTIVIDWEGLEKLAATAGSEEKGKAVEDYIKRLEELSGQFEEIDSKVLEIEKQVQDIRMRGMDAFTEMQERVLAAFVKARQDQIDEFQALSDTIADSTSRVIDGIREQVEAERQARQNEKAEEDIADKEARLAYLQRDTSGANDLEIMKLNDELAEDRQNYTDSLIDQGIEKMQEQADKAQEQRQRQIDLMTAQLALDQKNGYFNEAVQTAVEGALTTNTGYLATINTAMGTINGTLVQNSDGTGHFVTDTGEVLEAYEGPTGGWDVKLPDGSVSAADVSDIQNDVNTMQTDIVTVKTDTGVLKGYIQKTGADKGKFITDTGDVLTAKMKNGKWQVTLPSGAAATADVQGTTNAVGALKNLFTKGEGVKALTPEGAFKWESDLLTDIKKATEGWANFKMEMAKANGSVKASGKNLTWKNNKWLDADGNEYEVEWDSSGKFKATLKKKAEKKPETTTTTANSGSGAGSRAGSGSSSGGAGSGGSGSSKPAKPTKPATPTVLSHFSYAGSDYGERIAFEQAKAKAGAKITSANGDWVYDSKTNKYTYWTGSVVIGGKTYKNINAYKTGGLVDSTGLAWLDGTKSKPEIVLNQSDSQNFIVLKDILSQLLHNPIQSGTQGAGGDNYYEINIDAEIANDYDVDRLASRIKQQIYSDSMYRNVNTLNWQR